MAPIDVPATGTETRRDLARNLSTKGLDQPTSTSRVRAIIEVLCEALTAGEDVTIRDFGRFSVAEKGRRPVRNPRTGEDLILEPRRTVTFHPATALRNRVTAALCSTSAAGDDS